MADSADAPRDAAHPHEDDVRFWRERALRLGAEAKPAGFGLPDAPGRPPGSTSGARTGAPDPGPGGASTGPARDAAPSFADPPIVLHPPRAADVLDAMSRAWRPPRPFDATSAAPSSAAPSSAAETHDAVAALHAVAGDLARRAEAVDAHLAAVAERAASVRAAHARRVERKLRVAAAPLEAARAGIHRVAEETERSLARLLASLAGDGGVMRAADRREAPRRAAAARDELARECRRAARRAERAFDAETTQDASDDDSDDASDDASDDDAADSSGDGGGDERIESAGGPRASLRALRRTGPRLRPRARSPTPLRRRPPWDPRTSVDASPPRVRFAEEGAKEGGTDREEGRRLEEGASPSASPSRRGGSRRASLGALRDAHASDANRPLPLEYEALELRAATDARDAAEAVAALEREAAAADLRAARAKEEAERARAAARALALGVPGGDGAVFGRSIGGVRAGGATTTNAVANASFPWGDFGAPASLARFFAGGVAADEADGSRESRGVPAEKEASLSHERAIEALRGGYRDVLLQTQSLRAAEREAAAAAAETAASELERQREQLAAIASRLAAAAGAPAHPNAWRGAVSGIVADADAIARRTRRDAHFDASRGGEEEGVANPRGRKPDRRERFEREREGKENAAPAPEERPGRPQRNPETWETREERSERSERSRADRVEAMLQRATDALEEEVRASSESFGEILDQLRVARDRAETDEDASEEDVREARDALDGEDGERSSAAFASSPRAVLARVLRRAEARAGSDSDAATAADAIRDARGGGGGGAGGEDEDASDASDDLLRLSPDPPPSARSPSRRVGGSARPRRRLGDPVPRGDRPPRPNAGRGGAEGERRARSRGSAAETGVEGAYEMVGPAAFTVDAFGKMA